MEHLLYKFDEIKIAFENYDLIYKIILINIKLYKILHYYTFYQMYLRL